MLQSYLLFAHTLANNFFKKKMKVILRAWQLAESPKNYSTKTFALLVLYIYFQKLFCSKTKKKSSIHVPEKDSVITREYSCGYCLEKIPWMVDPRILQCGHVFCMQCLTNAKLHQNME